jgi:hypothetical protein
MGAVKWQRRTHSRAPQLLPESAKWMKYTQERAAEAVLVDGLAGTG